MTQFFSNVVITQCQMYLVALNEDVGLAHLEGTQGLGGGDLLSVWAVDSKGVFQLGRMGDGSHQFCRMVAYSIV